MEQDLRKLIQENNLFSSLTPAQIDCLIPLFRQQTFQANELIIHEGDPASAMFILINGEVEILKQTANNSEYHRISLLGAGAVIGEIALVDNTPRSASVRTLQTSTLLTVSINELQAFASSSTEALTIYNQLIVNIAREVTKRLRNTNETVVKSLTNELRLEKTRASIGRLIINLIIIISFYTFTLNIISRLTHAAASTTIIGAPIVSILVCITYFFIKKNKFPLSFYGITLMGWRQSLKESLLFSLPLLLLALLIKYSVIHSFSRFAQVPLFEFTATINNSSYRIFNGGSLFILPIIYLIFVPAQELVFRGVLQGSLEDFFTGRHKTWLAILVANFIFSMTHLHIGLGLALLVFLPGLFWGWLYARHRTLLGVTLSHILIGGFALFVMGINAFLK